MRERPIPFTADMVRAILDGRKTQTRRPVNPQLTQLGWNEGWFYKGYYWTKPGACPFGKPGDSLWVREPGRVVTVPCDDDGEGQCVQQYLVIEYLADKARSAHIPIPERFEHWPAWVAKRQGIPNGIIREAARLFLEIVSVRVERLEDITIADAQAEGFSGHGAIIPFIQTWSRVYQHRGFGCDAKPWVWVLEFKRVEASA